MAFFYDEKTLLVGLKEQLDGDSGALAPPAALASLLGGEYVQATGVYAGKKYYQRTGGGCIYWSESSSVWVLSEKVGGSAVAWVAAQGEGVPVDEWLMHGSGWFSSYVAANILVCKKQRISVTGTAQGAAGSRMSSMKKSIQGNLKGAANYGYVKAKDVSAAAASNAHAAFYHDDTQACLAGAKTLLTHAGAILLALGVGCFIFVTHVTGCVEGEKAPAPEEEKAPAFEEDKEPKPVPEEQAPETAERELVLEADAGETPDAGDWRWSETASDAESAAMVVEAETCEVDGFTVTVAADTLVADEAKATP